MQTSRRVTFSRMVPNPGIVAILTELQEKKKIIFSKYQKYKLHSTYMNIQILKKKHYKYM